MSTIDNYNEILKEVEIAGNRVGRSVTLLPVSKFQELEKLEELAKNGVKLFAESKIQEAVPKIEYLREKYSDLEFHYIGKIQTNKLKKVVEYFNLIHSIDRIDILKDIDKYAKQFNKKQEILIQLNIAHEVQKNGIDINEFKDFFNEVQKYENIILKGIMFMPPYFEDGSKNIPHFIVAQKIFNEYSPLLDSFTILSMGMSHDFNIAIDYGSTMVRVGSSIFGERQY